MGSFFSDDEFDGVANRVCASCGGEAVCHRITTYKGLAKTYRFKCAGCQREFALSSVFTLTLFLVAGLLILTLSPLILTQKDGTIGAAVYHGAIGLGFVVFSGYRIRTARKNPKRR